MKIVKMTVAAIYAFIFTIVFSILSNFYPPLTTNANVKKETFSVETVDVNICERDPTTGICNNTIEVKQPKIVVDTAYMSMPSSYYAPFYTTSYTINSTGQLTNGPNTLPHPTNVITETAPLSIANTETAPVLYAINKQNPTTIFTATGYYLYNADIFHGENIKPQILATGVNVENIAMESLLCKFKSANQGSRRVGFIKVTNSNNSNTYNIYGFVANNTTGLENKLTSVSGIQKAEVVIFDYDGSDVYSICENNPKNAAFSFSSSINDLRPISSKQLLFTPTLSPNSCPSCPPPIQLTQPVAQPAPPPPPKPTPLIPVWISNLDNLNNMFSNIW